MTVWQEQKERIAAVISNEEIINVIVIPQGEEGDKYLSENPDVVDITDMDPMPGIGIGWKYVDGEFVQPKASKEEVKQIRHINYHLYSDPLFFKWQRGEATKEEWLEAVQSIKDQFPLPEDEDPEEL